MASQNGEASLPNESVLELEDSLEMVDLLKRIGMNAFAAKVLLALHHHGPSSSSRLQSLCGLRQPEVSIGISKLKSHGSVIVSKIPAETQGRPRQVYELNGGMDDATKPFRESANRRLAEMTAQLGRLAELSDSMRALAN